MPTMLQAAEQNFTEHSLLLPDAQSFSAVLNMLPTPVSTPQLSSYPADAHAVWQMKKHLV